MRTALATVAMGLMVALLGACSLVDRWDGGGNVALDRAWTLESLDSGNGLVPPLPDRVPAMTLDAGEVTGTSGVNTFSGDYTWNRDGSFTFGQLAHTEMAGPPEAMAQEAAFFGALRAVRHFELADAELLLSDGDGHVILTFR